MNEFLNHEITDHEMIIMEKVIDNLMKQGKVIPSTDDILHELIRLSEISIKHFPQEINK